MISYFNFPVEKTVKKLISETDLKEKFPYIEEFKFNLRVGEKSRIIRNSLDRFGIFIISGDNTESLLQKSKVINTFVQQCLFEA